MLYRGADILIMDEPTAVLAPQEIDELMATMRSMVGQGKSIVFISHKLNEVVAVADIGKPAILHYLLTSDVKAPEHHTLDGNFLVKPRFRARLTPAPIRRPMAGSRLPSGRRTPCRAAAPWPA